MERWEGADPTKFKTVNGRQKKCFVEDLLKLFNGEELRRTELKQRFITARLGSDGTFNNLYREARDNGSIEECDNGKKLRAAPPKTDTEKSNNNEPQTRKGGGAISAKSAICTSCTSCTVSSAWCNKCKSPYRDCTCTNVLVCTGSTLIIIMSNRLTFGQYMGKSFEWLFFKAPWYAEWLYDENIHREQHCMSEEDGNYFEELFHRASHLTGTCKWCKKRQFTRMGLSVHQSGALGHIGFYCDECGYTGGSATEYYEPCFFMLYKAPRCEQLRIADTSRTCILVGTSG